MKNTVSICLSIYNQEKIIEQILFGILSNASMNVKEFIILLDGCTDQSTQIVREIISSVHQIDCKILESNDVWETKANNITFKNATCDYILTIQDDMLIQEKDFDQRMFEPFEAIENVFGVSARNAQDETIKDGKLYYFNLAGKDAGIARNIFSIRDVIIRGPILFHHEILRSLNYFDEEFAPAYAEDKDLSLRAYKQGFLVGAYAMNYYSPLCWGKARNWGTEKQQFWEKSICKNEQLIIERHSDLLLGNKHDQDIVIGGGKII